MEVYRAWKKEAEDIKDIFALCKFLEHLMQDYEHDYGTIVHAMEAGMLATYHMMQASPQGGITGFQASCLGWVMVRKFMGRGAGPLRLVSAEDILYPQYEYRFNTIPSEWATWLKEEAAKRLKENEGQDNVHTEVLEHWKNLAAGELPFGITVQPKED